MIILQNDDASAAVDGQDLRRRRHAVADRGDQRDVGGIGMDQAGRRCPCAFVLAIGEASVERPGFAFAPNRGAAGVLGSKRQRAIGSRIQVTDVARHLEEGAL
jgi:hypothetical protein